MAARQRRDCWFENMTVTDLCTMYVTTRGDNDDGDDDEGSDDDDDGDDAKDVTKIKPLTTNLPVS